VRITPESLCEFTGIRIIAKDLIMPNTWITNIQHFLNEEGDIVPIEGPARKIAEYTGEIISCITSSGKDAGTLQCKCRRRPNHKKCEGIIEAYIEKATNEIFWRCSMCHDNGRISHWEETYWDRRKS